MARSLRFEVPGGLYHVISRGNATHDIFIHDKDRRLFLGLLGNAPERFGWVIHAYCLMGNHYHLLVETPQPNLSKGMHYLNGVYCQAFNERHERIGHLFHGRFKSLIVNREEYLATLSRYIVLNPVRAGIAASPEHFAWSSYTATAGMRKAPAFLSTDLVLSLFHEDVPTARRIYRRYVMDGIGVKEEFKPKGGVVLGDDAFVLSLEKVLVERRGDVSLPVRQRYVDRPALESLLPAPGANGNKRNTEEIAKRNDAIYRAHVECRYAQNEIARHLHISKSQVCTVIRSKGGLRSLRSHAEADAAEQGNRTLEE
jgi:putative transposase